MYDVCIYTCMHACTYICTYILYVGTAGRGGLDAHTHTDWIDRIDRVLVVLDVLGLGVGRFRMAGAPVSSAASEGAGLSTSLGRPI